jgi:hypothetical protein
MGSIRIFRVRLAHSLTLRAGRGPPCDAPLVAPQPGCDYPKAMNRKLIAGLAGAGLLTAFGAYVGAQLQRHGQECDSALRHCPVPLAELQAIQGAWCNAEAAGRMGPVRMTFTLAGERLRLATATPGAGRPATVTDTRFFLENGRVIFFEYDPATGAQREGKITLARTGPDRIETQALNVRVPWLRCDRLRENGVPEPLQALFAGT